MEPTAMDLKKYFDVSGILQKEFAKKAGISTRQLSRIVNFHAVPSAVIAYKIITASNGKVTLIGLVGYFLAKETYG